MYVFLQNKVLIRKKDRNKLLFSNITENYPWLLKLLQENEKISNLEVANLNEDKQNFIKHLIPNILNEASKEWKPSHEVFVRVLEGNKRKRCSLCGTPNKYIYYITQLSQSEIGK